MTEAKYMYTTSWVADTGRPRPGHRWLDEAGAREAFAAHSLEVVRVVKHRESDGAVRAMWVMGLAFKAGVRVQWMQGRNTVWRVNDFEWFDGRLFRTVTSSYDYPDTEHQYMFSESLEMRSLTVLPDGSGHTIVGPGNMSLQGASWNQRPAEWMQAQRVEKVTGYRTDNLWIDYPEFGDWEPLADPSFGVDPE